MGLIKQKTLIKEYAILGHFYNVTAGAEVIGNCRSVLEIIRRRDIPQDLKQLSKSVPDALYITRVWRHNFPSLGTARVAAFPEWIFGTTTFSLPTYRTLFTTFGFKVGWIQEFSLLLITEFRWLIKFVKFKSYSVSDKWKTTPIVPQTRMV